MPMLWKMIFLPTTPGIKASWLPISVTPNLLVGRSVNLEKVLFWQKFLFLFFWQGVQNDSKTGEKCLKVFGCQWKCQPWAPGSPSWQPQQLCDHQSQCLRYWGFFIFFLFLAFFCRNQTYPQQSQRAGRIRRTLRIPPSTPLPGSSPTSRSECSGHRSYYM